MHQAAFFLLTLIAALFATIQPARASIYPNQNGTTVVNVHGKSYVLPREIGDSISKGSSSTHWPGASLPGGGTASTPTAVALRKIPATGGGEVQIRTKVGLSALAIGKGLFRGAVAAATVGAGVFFTGKELFDIWSDLGYSVDEDGTINKTSGGTLPVHYFGCGNPSFGGYSDPNEYLAANGGTWGGTNHCAVNNWPGSMTQLVYQGNGGMCSFKCTGESPLPGTGTSTPLTEEQFLDEMPSLSGWDKASEALRQAMGYNEARQAFDEEMEKTSGPTTPNAPTEAKFPNPTGTGSDVNQVNVGQPKQSSSSKQLPNGSTETTQKTDQQKATASGNSITYHTSSVTNIYNDTTNETTTITEESEDEAPEGTAVDTPLGDVPELYEQKYPDGLTGVWNTRKAEMTGSPLFQLVDVLLPNLGQGGTCPSWTMNLDLTSWAQFGTHDISPACWLWEFAYWVVIVSALILARSLIFGG